MQKLEFGYSNDIDPKGSHEGMGLKQGLFLTEADYYGALEINGEQFVVTKVTEDKYNRYPDKLGNFMVLPAIADMCKDGSGVLFVCQEGSDITKHIEKMLNESEYKDRFTSVRDIKSIYNGLNYASRSFDILTDERYCGNSIITTAITPEAFGKKNAAYKSCNGTFTDLSSQINEMNNSKSY